MTSSSFSSPQSSPQLPWEAFQELLNFSTDALMITRVSDSTIVYTNASLARQFGADVDQLIGRDALALYPDPEVRKQLVTELQAAGELEGYRLEVVSPSGKRFVTRSHFKLIEHEGELLILSSHRDVTKEERQDQELRTLNQNYRAILNSSVEPLMITRLSDGKVLYANQQMADLMKATVPELLERFAPSFYCDPSARKLLTQTIQKGWSFSQMRVELINNELEVVTVRVSAQLIEFSGESALVASFQDITRKEKLQRELEETLELQALANRAIGVTYWTWDIEDNTLSWDPFGYELFEVDLQEQNLFERFMERIDPQDRPHSEKIINDSLQAAFSAVVPEPTPHSYEFRMNLPSGRTRVIRSDFQIRLLEGKMTMLGTSQDVTQEVRLRRASQERLAQLELISEHARIGFWIQEDGEEAWWDESMRQMYQLGEEERPDYHAFIQRLHPRTRDEQLERLNRDNERAFQGESVKNFFHLLLPDQTEIFVDHYVQARDMDRGLRLVGVAIDVTEREQQLMQIREANEIRLLSNEAARIGYWSRAFNETTSYQDPYCQKLLELPAKISTEDLLARLTPEAQSSLMEYREELIQNGRASVELELDLPSGTQRFIRSYQRLIEHNGQKQIVGLSQDITEEVQQRETLKRQERFAALGQLAAEINHDLKQPLSILDLRLFQLRGLLDPEKQERGERAWRASHEALQHAKSIIARTLSVTRMIDERTPQALSSVIEQAAELFSSTFRHQHIEWSFDHPWAADEEPQLYVNRNDLLQVLQNLIANALDAIEERKQRDGLDSGTLRVSLAETEEAVVLELEDSGVGVSLENQKKIFDQFFTTKGEEGTGLGLSMCRRVMQEHHGDLQLRDRSDGEPGAVLVLTLPKPVLTPEPLPEDLLEP